MPNWEPVTFVSAISPDVEPSDREITWVTPDGVKVGGSAPQPGAYLVDADNVCTLLPDTSA
ncbi:hypothetical protein [Frankia sp. AgB32]|uniref:hypothetical protein n=1 Tax=Frankia sp. AgB32 TaxID=631119 RepID=UPI00200DE0ED|nr:hypothetical protein [Frankia sp. AgB32]MCK9896990.1 hypothetical protein [Frankia sp. AgB32]